MKKRAFTLAESAAHAGFGNNHRRYAFTLAETLITLMVIGVVAALTIPALMQQINGYTLQKQKDVFSKKWAEGLRQMRVDGKLETKYSSTAEFVNEMQKYFKIQAVCDSNNLTGCYAEKITSYENGEAEEFDVKDLKSAKNFNKSEEDSDVYGIKFSDGTSMLLAYKKDCTGISEGDTQGNHTACLLYVYDVNANKSPNTYGGNTGKGSNKSDSEIATMNKDRDMVGNASITKGNAYGLSFSFEEKGALDYRSAISACGGEDKLPSDEQLDEIAKAMYIDSGACTRVSNISYYNDLKCDTTLLQKNPLWQKFGGNNVSFSIWGGSISLCNPNDDIDCSGGARIRTYGVDFTQLVGRMYDDEDRPLTICIK